MAKSCPPGQAIQQNDLKCEDILCPDGQYYDSDLAICNNCNQICSKCSYFSDYCSECKSGFYLYKDKCLTACPQTQTYVQCLNQKCTCEPCNSSCVSCFGKSDKECLRCNASFYFNSVNTSCKKDCEEGYSKVSIQIGDSTQLKCIRCDKNCRSCDQNNPSLCLDCKDNMYLFNSTCLYSCPEKYQKLGGICVACPSGCQQCYGESPQSCSSCVENYFLDIENQNCLSLSCPTGFTFDQSSRSCLPCHPSCKSCSDLTQEGCTQCQNGHSLISSAPSKCQNRCSDGSYSSNSACLSCNISICSTCFGSGTNQCISCQNDYFLFKTECLVACPLSQFSYEYAYKGTPQICRYCPPEMEQCEQDSNDIAKLNAILCKSGYYLQDNACVKYCKNATYYADDASRTCIQCPFPCQECLNDKTCISCTFFSETGQFYQFSTIMKEQNNGIVLLEEKCSPICPEGYFSLNGICQQCHMNCLSCSGPSGTDCVTCQKYDQYNQLFKHNNQCFYNCPSSQSNPMYGDSLSQQCQSCQSECSSCFAGDNSSCYQCKNGYYLEYNQPQCKTFCSNENTYADDISNSCELCKYGCATCSGGKFNNCISCLEGYYLVAEFNECKKCNVSCSSCTSFDECSKCNSGYFLLDNSCVSSCPLEGYYLDLQSLSCIQCNQQCRECYDLAENQCISCNSQYYLDKDSTCQQCDGNCSECTGPLATDCTNKLSCEKGMSLFDGECIKCFESCGTCYGSSYDACIDCESESMYFLLFDVCKDKQSEQDTSCDQGYYYDANYQKCFSCHHNCLACTGKTNLDCQKCAEGYLYHPEISACESDCIDGYVRESEQIAECTSCQVGCTDGCGINQSILFGVCYSSCPFGSENSQNKCTLLDVPQIKFGQNLPSIVNNNIDELSVWADVYSLERQYSLQWKLFEQDKDVSDDARFKRFLQNRGNWIQFPIKTLLSSTSYKMQISLFESGSQCLKMSDCYIQQSFMTSSGISAGTFNVDLDYELQQIIVILTDWSYQQSTDHIYFDVYISNLYDDEEDKKQYFFLTVGEAYTPNQKYTFLLPQLSSSSKSYNYILCMYNEEDFLIVQQSVIMKIDSQTFNLNIFSDAVYASINSISQIQNAAINLATYLKGMNNSLFITNRHLFFQVYYSLKGEQLECDNTIHCSGRGQCLWNAQNYNEVECSCFANFGGRYCEFDSFQLDVSRQHLNSQIDKISNYRIAESQDIFMILDTLIILTQYSSIFDEFTLNTVQSSYLKMLNQLGRQEYSSILYTQQITFKMAKLTSQLIHLANESDTISYSDQRYFLLSTVEYFEQQLQRLLINYAESAEYLNYYNISTIDQFSTGVTDISIIFLSQNTILDLGTQIDFSDGDDDKGPQQNEETTANDQFILLSGGQTSFSFNLELLTSTQPLQVAVVEWKSNPFLPLHQYNTPFITSLSRVYIYQGSNLFQLSANSQYSVDIALPKILRTPKLPASKSYLPPYTCVYFDEIDEQYKQDGVKYISENSTHVICRSEQLYGSFGAIVNWQGIDYSNLNIMSIWEECQDAFIEDTSFKLFMDHLIKNITSNSNNNKGSSSQQLSDLFYGMSIYIILCIGVFGITFIRDWRDKNYQCNSSDYQWLISPIYSVLCGPFSTIFPRITRAMTLTQILCSHLLFSSILSSTISAQEQNSMYMQIGAISCTCCIVLQYLTVGLVNLTKIRWIAKQQWTNYAYSQLNQNILDYISKGIKFYQLIFFSSALFIQLSSIITFTLLLIYNDEQQSTAFLPSLLFSISLDILMDIFSLMLFFAVSKFLSSSHKSSLILFFTLRGFFYPVHDFYELEKKLQNIDNNQLEQIASTEQDQEGEIQKDQIKQTEGLEGEEEEDFEESIELPQPKVFTQRQQYVKNPQEALKIQDFVKNIETKW